MLFLLVPVLATNCRSHIWVEKEKGFRYKLNKVPPFFTVSHILIQMPSFSVTLNSFKFALLVALMEVQQRDLSMADL